MVCRAGALPFPNGADFCKLNLSMRQGDIYHSFSSEFARQESGMTSRDDKKGDKKTYFFRDKLVIFVAKLAVGVREVIFRVLKRKKVVKDNSASSFFAKMARAFAGFSLVILLVSYGPSFWYETEAFLGGDKTEQILAKTVNEEALSAIDFRKTDYRPEYDPNLPEENRIVISSIGVDTQVEEATAENYEVALRKGVWRVSDFGTPHGREMPTILAAHRYGYLRWNNSYRRENSFFNLPKLNLNDKVEIVWRQRKYVYEIYAQERGEEITDYSADLILYTCESLNSPVRLFKYARLLEV